MTKNKTVEWKTSLAELLPDEFRHPGLKMARFVFCDDKPNQNGMGVEYEDFAEVIKSSIGTPVKMKFLGQTVSGHVGSVPIGHITNMFENELEDGTHQLIADASLYADDYPDEIDWLEQKFAKQEAPGISFEMTYHTTLLKDGVKWLKGLVARAATFVHEPAYGTRTALLALASNTEISAETFMEELAALTGKEPKDDKGGNNVTEEEAKKLRDELEAAKAEASKYKEQVDTLTATNTDLTGKLEVADTKIAAYAQKELVSTRQQALVEAGIKIETDPAKLEKKQAFWAALEEEAFAEYVDDLKAASVVEKKVVASKTTAALPRFSGNEDGQAPSSMLARVREIKATRVASE